MIGDKLWVYRGWHTVNLIDNNGKTFTPEILVDRVQSELLKNIPSKQKMNHLPREIFE